MSWHPDDDLDEPIEEAWAGDAEDDWESEVVECPECGHDVYELSDQCPNCGHFISPNSHPWSGRSQSTRRRLVIVVWLLIGALLLPFLAVLVNLVT
jgi:DNA-directed RNA polymerase subunit RPC12/RpoP